MPYTKTKNKQEARKELMKGAEELYNLVATTQGPQGRNIAINKGFDFDVFHDGLKVSRFVQPLDQFQALGAGILREAAEKQVSQVGDGTTLTVVLGYQIAKEAMILVDAGINPMSLVAGLERGRDILVSEITKLAKPIKNKKEKIQIATVASQDKILGEMIGSTYHKIGIEGIIVADESQSNDTTLEHEEGISIDRGFLSPYFITDPRTLTATVKNACILFLEREIDDAYEFLAFYENCLKPKNIRNLVIIANDVKGAALASLIENKRRGLMNILAVKAPAFGKYKRELLEDIAIMTGGQVVDEASDKQLKDVPFEYLGFAETVKASKDATTILGNRGNLKAINDRQEAIKMLLKDPESDLDAEKLKERLSKMTGGVYVIKTGGATEVEMNERKERVDDAIRATRAAIEGGIMPGGEVSFLLIRKQLEASNTNEEYAFRILHNALEKPFEKLLENAGMNAGYHMAKIEDKPYGWGVNVVSNQLENLVESGIIDPALVLTEALRSAVSVAILLITCDGVSVVCEDEKK